MTELDYPVLFILTGLYRKKFSDSENILIFKGLLALELILWEMSASYFDFINRRAMPRNYNETMIL